MERRETVGVTKKRSKNIKNNQDNITSQIRQSEKMVAAGAVGLADQLPLRPWPEPVKDSILGDYENAPYVRHGRVFTRALRQHQQVSAAIAPGESGITSLCLGGNGKIYGATTGSQSHLFYYDPSPAGDGVGDIGILPGVKSVRRSVVAPGAALIVAGASEMQDAGAGGPLFVYDTTIDYMDEFRTFRGSIEQATIPVKGECVGALCRDFQENGVWGISSVTGVFFRFDVNTKKVKQYGKVTRDRAFSRCLVGDNQGRIYGTHSLGSMYRYDPAQDRVIELDSKIPSVAGREFYNQLDSAVFNPVNDCIYGAGTADGLLFELDTHTLQIRTLGKPSAGPRVRALTVTSDGRIFGINGAEGGMGRLFCYDPRRRELCDLGIMLAASEIWRRGFEFEAAAAGSNGELYFGENEWESNLFMYFPAPPQKDLNYHDIPF